jgi:maltose/moltooligosaccharide transporter
MKLNYGKTFLLGLGFFGVSVIWSVYNAYVPIFLKDRFFMATGFIGMFMTLDNIAALFIQPAVGAYSDRLHTRIGRRMPFIIASAPIAAISFALMPMTTSMFVFFLAALFLLLSMAVWRTPIIALMPDITPSKYRSQANGIINLMGGLGAIIAYLLGAKLYTISPDYPFWLGAGLVLISAILVFIFIKEPKTHEETPEEQPQLIKSLGTILQEKDKSALLILLAILFWFISYSGIEAFFTLYAKEFLGFPEADGARLLGQLSLLFVISALPAGYLGAAIGRRKTIMTGIVLMSIGIFSTFLLPIATLTKVLAKLPILGTVPVIGLILMGIGIAWSLININSLPMVLDMTDESHNGTFTGLYYLFSTLAAIIGPVMYGWIVQLSGNQYNLLMLVSPIFLVAAFVAMLFVRRGEAKSQ